MKRSAARWLRGGLILLLLLSVLSGCRRPRPETTTPEPVAPDPNAKPAVVLPLDFHDARTGMKLRAPEGWVAVPYEGAVIALLSPLAGVDDYFQENLLIIADETFKEPTLDAYVKALVTEVAKRYPDTKTLERAAISVAGVPGQVLIDSFTHPKGSSVAYRVVFIREGRAFVIHGTAPVGTFERYRPIFTAMVESVQFLPTTTP